MGVALSQALRWAVGVQSVSQHLCGCSRREFGLDVQCHTECPRPCEAFVGPSRLIALMGGCHFKSLKAAAVQAASSVSMFNAILNIPGRAKPLDPFTSVRSAPTSW